MDAQKRRAGFASEVHKRLKRSPRLTILVQIRSDCRNDRIDDNQNSTAGLLDRMPK